MIKTTEYLPRNIQFTQQNNIYIKQNNSYKNITQSPFQIKNNFYNDQKYMFKTSNQFQSEIKGFNSYFKNYLLINNCLANDLQYICNNPLVFQEDVRVNSPSPTKQKNIQKKQQHSPTNKNTIKNISKHQTNEEQKYKKSKEAQLNEFLFNYRKQEQQKKNKKIKFLSDIQQKINNIQKQTNLLQANKQSEYKQLNQILLIQNQNTNLASKAVLIGKLNSAIHQSDIDNIQHLSPPKKITDEMQIIQINAAIDEQHIYNDALLNQIQKVSRSGSKQRVKDKSNDKSYLSIKTNIKPQSSSMSKTIKKPMEYPPRPYSSKKMIKTWKGKNKI